MILTIYTPILTNRIKYSTDLIFKQLLGIAYQLETDATQFVQHSASYKLNYSSQVIDNVPFIRPASLLLETDINIQTIELGHWKNLPIAFQSSDNQAIVPFDLLAWAFYLVSRYEEYLPFEADAHGRFSAKNSLAVQHDFLKLPLVNLLALEFGKILKESYPNLLISKLLYQFTPSYDIDYMYAFRGKEWWRQLGGWARAVLKLDKETLRLQWKAWLNKKEDAFYTFDYQDFIHKKYNVQPLYFFLIADWGEYDKNLPFQSPLFQKCVQHIENQYHIGVHPSYRSNESLAILQKEYHRLAHSSQQTIFRSRQHFLKLEFPKTYQNLLSIGIREDYTMGYADALGFRASIANPFYWFDLSKNEATELRIFPFSVMDVTLNTYLKLSTDAALEQISYFIEQTKNVGGHFIPVWHNSSLCEAWQWKGWRAVYEKLVEQAL